MKRCHLKRKILAGILMGLVLILSSCYPELSVQQYDKLREDIEALDTERHELQERVEELEAELADIKAKTPVAYAYIKFLNQVVSTQSSAKILEGEFDVNALISDSLGLTIAAEELEDNQILYFISLMDPENESQTVAVYYKIIEYCVKKIKQNLE